MSGCIVQIWFGPKDDVHPPAKAEFWIFETTLPDFESVCMAVDADRWITGNVLYTRKSGPHVYEVTRRQPGALRGSAVTRVALPWGRYFTCPAEAAE